MAFSRRIHCHFCGTRSPHAKSLGIPQFQCASCEAWNFLDANGDTVDPPHNFITQASAAQEAHDSQKISLFSAPEPQRDDVFCNTCLHNQHVYNETLANYLPDESHPDYSKFECLLPQYKQDLEQRYPLVCKDCAPKAQFRIHRADYDSMTNHASRLLRGSKGSRREITPESNGRDDGFKMGMRIILNVVGWVVFASAMFQCAWHIWAIFSLLPGNAINNDYVPYQPVSGSKLHYSQDLHSDISPYRRIGASVSTALAVSLCLLWYNHGLKDFFDPLVRIDSVTGQAQHFSISLIILIIRTVAYCTLSAPATTSHLTGSESLAAHAFTLIMIIAGRYIAHRCIESHRWRLKGHMMPRPEDCDVLGQHAGPAPEKHTPQASLSFPAGISSRPTREPFPIHRLAQDSSTHGRWAISGGAPPSPPKSDTTMDDPMDIEPVPPAQEYSSGRNLSTFTDSTRHRNVGNNASAGAQRGLFDLQPNETRGWDSMRSNLFSIDDAMHTEQQRLRFQPPTQQNLFRGCLPQAPMSMERRLRNPISQVPQFKEVPLTQRQDFLQQMRIGIEKGRGFGVEGQLPPTAPDLEDSESNDAFTPAKNRTKGQLDLQSSGWHLPSDVNAATGLEEVFSSSFRIDDEHEMPSTATEAARNFKVSPEGRRKVASLLLLGLAFGLNVGGMRTMVCLALVRGLERMGY